MKHTTSIPFPKVCPHLNCPSHPRVKAGDPNQSPAYGHFVRKGSFYRRSDAKRIRRFQCVHCRRTFSQATLSACYRQKKRHLNEPIFLLMNSLMNMNRVSRHLGINRKTVARKLLFLGFQAMKFHHEKFLREYAQVQPGGLITQVQFDELETSEVSKCFGVSVAVMVSHPDRKILGVQVASMPPKGPLVKVYNKKYRPRLGARIDERAKRLEALFHQVAPHIHPQATLTSDECPRYPNLVKNHFPCATHNRVKGVRGCVAGQGELKKTQFDPLFSLNHTCAMLRANISRLIRRTWCNTKKRHRLLAHLYLYMQYHNTQLTACT